MYMRQFGYSIVPGFEERAIVLCRSFIEALHVRGIRARVTIATEGDMTLQVIEEYPSIEAMLAVRSALECDENYRSAVSKWAAEFYPLVRAAIPTVISQSATLKAA